MELEAFKKLHGFFIEDLRLNQTDQIERKITERDIDDFDYYISDLQSQYPNPLVYSKAVGDLPYYCKTVEVDDEYERTSSIKIGDAVIQYTFNKLRRQGLIEDSEVIPLFEHYDPYKSTIENVIAQTKLSHNRPDKLKVIKLNRKENNVLQLHNK